MRRKRRNTLGIIGGVGQTSCVAEAVYAIAVGNFVLAAYALVYVEAVVDELHHVGCARAEAFSVAGGSVREVRVMKKRRGRVGVW